MKKQTLCNSYRETLIRVRRRAAASQQFEPRMRLVFVLLRLFTFIRIFRLATLSDEFVTQPAPSSPVSVGSVKTFTLYCLKTLLLFGNHITFKNYIMFKNLTTNTCLCDLTSSRHQSDVTRRKKRRNQNFPSRWSNYELVWSIPSLPNNTYWPSVSSSFPGSLLRCCPKSSDFGLLSSPFSALT